jgi:hypothetical protein
MIQIPTSFKGYFTIHGEGETDGIRKIKFSSTDKQEERNMSILIVHGPAKPKIPK